MKYSAADALAHRAACIWTPQHEVAHGLKISYYKPYRPEKAF